MQESWSDRARKKIMGWQERAYGDLAEDFGLGWQPQKAYERLTLPRMPDDWISVIHATTMFGKDIVPDADWTGFADVVNQYKKRYFVDPPTPYEDPNLYSTVVEHLDAILASLSTTQYSLPARPLVATIPSADLNARIRSMPSTGEAAILFHHGLMLFLHQFSIVVGMAVPAEWLGFPIRPADPSRGEPGDVDHTRRAAEQLATSLTAYVVDGNPRLAQMQRPRERALVSAATLARSMRLFVLSHELMHLMLGHQASTTAKLSKEQAWQREFDADMVGSSLSVCTGEDAGVNGVIGLWACDVALAAFDLIERCISYLETGNIDGPTSDTHPPPVQRRQELLRTKPKELLQDGRMSDASRLEELITSCAERIEQLWQATQPHWDELRRQGIRPSPIWRPHADPTNE